MEYSSITPPANKLSHEDLACLYSHLRMPFTLFRAEVKAAMKVGDDRFYALRDRRFGNNTGGQVYRRPSEAEVNILREITLKCLLRLKESITDSCGFELPFTEASPMIKPGGLSANDLELTRVVYRCFKELHNHFRNEMVTVMGIKKRFFYRVFVERERPISVESMIDIQQRTEQIFAAIAGVLRERFNVAIIPSKTDVDFKFFPH